MIIIRKYTKEFSTKLSRGIAGFNKKVLRMSPMKSKRKAIDSERKIIFTISKGLNKLEKANKSLRTAMIDPGEAVSKGIETTLKHPISATSQVAGKATMVIDPTGTGLVPIGAIGTAGEVALRKYSPKYAKVTDKLSSKYSKSKAKDYVSGAVNGMTNFFKYNV